MRASLLAEFDDDADSMDGDERTAAAPAPQAPVLPATDYTYWGMACLPALAREFNLTLLLVPPYQYKPGLLALLLRHPRVVGCASRLVDLAEQQGSTNHVLILLLRLGLLHDVVFGQMYGPGVLSLCAQAMTHALTVRNESNAQAAGNCATLAFNIISKLYAAGDQLPATLDASLVEQLQLLLPIVKLTAQARASTSRYEVVSRASAFLTGRLEKQVRAASGAGLVKIQAWACWRQHQLVHQCGLYAKLGSRGGCSKVTWCMHK